MTEVSRTGGLVGVLMLSGLLSACGGGGGDKGGGGGNPAPQTFTVGGTVTGLAGNLTLQNGGTNLAVSANGSFAFTAALAAGASYAVSVQSAPALQSCSIANAVGTVTANVTNVAVTCSNVAAPALALSLRRTKTFHFTWNALAGATHYRLLEDATGNAGFTQVGADLPSGSAVHDLVVPLHLRVNARYIVRACAAALCIDSNTVQATGSLADAIGYVKASNTDSSDAFGIAVALSADGSTLAVGASAEDSSATGVDGSQASNGAAQAGAVYVFAYTQSGWAQQAYIKASNAETLDTFGSAVALSGNGDTLAVGAPTEDGSSAGVNGSQGNGLNDTGAAYLFQRNGAVWTQVAYVKASNPESDDLFGDSLTLAADGRTLAVGAHLEDGGSFGINGNQASNGSQASGAVYVFTELAGTWSQQAYIKASNTDASDFFGYDLALSADGDTLAVGASGEDGASTGVNGSQISNAVVDSGAVYVFTRSGGAWSQQAYIKASNADANDQFGFHVALNANGRTLAVVSRLEDSNAVGADGNQADNSAADSGAVYVFVLNVGTWQQQAYLKTSNTDIDDRFGSAVALSADGNYLLAGAVRERGQSAGLDGVQTDNSGPANAGAAYLFHRAVGAWSQVRYIKAAMPAVSPIFSDAVSMSGDAGTIAIGAWGENSAATGVNGDIADNTLTSAGAVFLY
jgi:trimeric autotransporter adhesin